MIHRDVDLTSFSWRELNELFEACVANYEETGDEVEAVDAQRVQDEIDRREDLCR